MSKKRKIKIKNQNQSHAADNGRGKARVAKSGAGRFARIGLIAAAFVLLAGAAFLFFGRGAPVAYAIDQYPDRIVFTCYGGLANFYDECTDQREVLAEGLKRAEAAGKAPLIHVGAEWCTWCHTIGYSLEGAQGNQADGYFEQGSSRVKFTDGPIEENADALALTQYVQDNFYVIHLEVDRAPGGQEAGVEAGLDANQMTREAIPQLFSLALDGKMWDYMGNQPGEWGAMQVIGSEETFRGTVIERGVDPQKMLTLLERLLPPGY